MMLPDPNDPNAFPRLVFGPIAAAIRIRSVSKGATHPMKRSVTRLNTG